MAVRPLAAGKWLVDVYPAGGKGLRTRRVVSGLYEEALDLERELTMGSAEFPATLRSPTIGQLLPDYLAWARLHLAPATVRDLTRSFVTLKARLGPREFLKLSTTDLEQYKQHRTQGGAHRIFRSVNKELDYLRGLIKWAVRIKGLPRPRALFTPLPYDQPLPKLPRAEDVEALLAQITPRSRHADRKRAAVLCMWECGMRWNETRHLRWEDVDVARRLAIIRKPKGPKQRLVPLTKRLVALLEPFAKPTGWIFENTRTGKPWGSLKQLFRNASIRANVPRIGRHVLRHAWATDTLTAGGDTRTVQAILGHADIRQTQWYTRVMTQAITETADRTTAYRQNQAATGQTLQEPPAKKYRK